MGTGPAFASPIEAAEALLAGLRFLAAADPTEMMVCEQAQLLQILEQARAMSTAVQAQTLGAFTAVQG